MGRMSPEFKIELRRRRDEYADFGDHLTIIQLDKLSIDLPDPDKFHPGDKWRVRIREAYHPVKQLQLLVDHRLFKEEIEFTIEQFMTEDKTIIKRWVYSGEIVC